jgi:leukotriene-A4 hydrolase
MRRPTIFTGGSALIKSIHITIRSPSFQSGTARQPQRHLATASTTRSMAPRDPTTLANYGTWVTRHTTVNFKVNFEKQRLEGSVVLELESLTDKESKEIILDTNAVNVSSVKLNSADSLWKLQDKVEPFGSPLSIQVPDGASKGDIVKVDIALETTSECVGLQWMTPAQTGNKKHPYVYSQCQAILARSIFPCQDTPDVKSTYTFNITSPLPVVASGVPQPSDESGEGEKLFRFEQKVPIPSYLFAVASGDLKFARIGKNSVVATGPEAIDAAKWEFEDDMDKFLDVAQKIVFDYQWGEYNVLVLPPSFAYGGKCYSIVRSNGPGNLKRDQAWKTPSSRSPPPPSSVVTDRTWTSLRTSLVTAGVVTW